VSLKTRTLSIVAAIAICAAVSGTRESTDPALGADAGQTLKKSIWGPTEAGGRSLFPAYRDLGIGIYQFDLRWYRTAKQRPADPTDPNDPAYAWPAELDQAVAEAAATGMEVSIRILGTPLWANGGRNARFVPDNPGDYADFAVATAKRYPNVRLWSVWGEPNRASMFGPLTPSRVKGPLNAAQQVAPRNYAILLDRTYGALKALNPANLIIGGNTFNTTGNQVIHPYQWIRYLVLPDGSRPRMDLYGHNPFCYRKPTLHARPSPRGRVDFSDLPRFAKALDRYFPGQSLRFFLAEWGVDVGSEVEGRFRVTAKTQARWIRAGYRIARTWDRIYTLGWVRAIDTDISSGGLMDVNGNPKPGYYVFKAS
jgi:hypothetical protein